MFFHSGTSLITNAYENKKYYCVRFSKYFHGLVANDLLANCINGYSAIIGTA